jgi:hypothetical protein
MCMKSSGDLVPNDGRPVKGGRKPDPDTTDKDYFVREVARSGESELS